MEAKLNFPRIVLCGLIAGVSWHLLSAVALTLCGRELLDALQSQSEATRRSGLYFLALDVAMGICALWIYASLQPRFGPGIKTAAYVGLVWWLIKTLQSAKWVGLGFVPLHVTWVPLALTLPAILIATTLGAWFYKE
jgi:hypothetical protein